MNSDSVVTMSYTPHDAVDAERVLRALLSLRCWRLRDATLAQQMALQDPALPRAWELTTSYGAMLEVLRSVMARADRDLETDSTPDPGVSVVADPVAVRAALVAGADALDRAIDACGARYCLDAPRRCAANARRVARGDVLGEDAALLAHAVARVGLEVYCHASYRSELYVFWAAGSLARCVWVDAVGVRRVDVGWFVDFVAKCPEDDDQGKDPSPRPRNNARFADILRCLVPYSVVLELAARRVGSDGGSGATP